MAVVARRGTLAVIVAVIAVLAGPSPIAAAAASGHFLDDKPLLVDVSADQDPTVAVVNSGKNPARYTLAVVGDAAEFLTAPVTPRKVPAGATRELTLGVTGEPTPVSGTLVLTGKDGTLERLSVQLVGVTVPEGDALIAGTFDELSVPAVSRVPSFIRPIPGHQTDLIGWLVMAVVVAGLAGWWFRRTRAKGGRSSTVPAAVTLVAALAIVWLLPVVVVQTVNELVDDQPVAEIHRTLALGSTGTPTATLSGDTGGAGRVQADGTDLTITGLDGAGTFTGTVDTRPTGDGGDIKTVVTVHDHWAWAALVVALGVVVGFLVSFYYGRRRNAAKLAVTLADARRESAARESAWDLRSGGEPWHDPYVADGYVTRRLDRAALSVEGDPAAATSEVTAVRGLVDKVDALRTQVAAEAERALQVRAELAEAFGGLALHPRWLEPLLEPLGLGDLSPTEATSLVSDRAKLLESARATRQQADVAAEDLLALGVRIVRSAGEGRDPAKVREIRARWTTLGPSLVDATGEDDIDTVRTSMAALATELEALPPPLPVGQEQSLRETAAAGAGAALELVLGRVRSLREQHEADDLAQAEVERDGLLDIAVEVTALPGEDVFWRFSDGTAGNPFSPGTGAVTLRTRHAFDQESSVLGAEVVSGVDERVLGSWAGRATAQGRTDVLRRSLASDDRFVALIAFVLAVGSGMVALYVTDSTWGSAGDYLTALLWGAVTAEGIKQLANVLDNWGLSK